MRNAFSMARWLSLSGLVLAAFPPREAAALVITINDPSGKADFATLKAAAAGLTDAAEAGTGTVDGFLYEIAEGPLVPARFSKTGGAPTYIWSSNALKFEGGFDFRAGPFAFGKKAAPKLAKEGPTAPPAPMPAWKTGFGKATLTATSLNLEYELAKGEAVSAALFDARGKSVASWTWREASAGRHVKVFTVEKRVTAGPLFLRLKAGEVRMVRKVRVE